MDRLAAMRVFSEVVQRGSFTAAAEQLGMTRVMATRYVAELERWLDSRLLQRSTRRISLTEAGESFLAQCQQMLELSAAMQDRSGRRNEKPMGQLRITTSTSFGIAHLAVAISDYLRIYPDVSVDMQMVDRAVNLIEERIDLAVRISGELDPNLVARRIAPCRSVACTSPDYIARRGLPAEPGELSRHNCLTYANFGKGEWRFSQGNLQVSVPIAGNLSGNDATFLLQAALAGAGVAMLPTYLAGPLIREGRLVQLLPNWQPAELTIWAVYLSRRHVPASLRAMIDFLIARFGPTPSWDSA